MYGGLCTRAIIPVSISITGFVVVSCILLFGGIKSDMTEEALRHTGDLADTIAKSTRYAMLKDDRDMLRNMINNIGTQNGVELVRIYNSQGLIMLSKNPSEERRQHGPVDPGKPAFDLHQRQIQQFVNVEQTPVLAVNTPIFNEPQCSSAACHFHEADGRLLGFLNVGLSQKPLEKSLAVLSVRMIIFSVMVLMLTVGGVAALLRRNVFLPMTRLLEYTDRAVELPHPSPFPEIGGEIERLSGNYARLLAQRDAARQQLAGAMPSEVPPPPAIPIAPRRSRKLPP